MLHSPEEIGAYNIIVLRTIYAYFLHMRLMSTCMISLSYVLMVSWWPVYMPKVNCPLILILPSVLSHITVDG